jgi:hypothetical protein
MPLSKFHLALCYGVFAKASKYRDKLPVMGLSPQFGKRTFKTMFSSVTNAVDA